jgi:hypothetical protein
VNEPTIRVRPQLRRLTALRERLARAEHWRRTARVRDAENAAAEARARLDRALQLVRQHPEIAARQPWWLHPEMLRGDIARADAEVRDALARAEESRAEHTVRRQEYLGAERLYERARAHAQQRAARELLDIRDASSQRRDLFENPLDGESEDVAGE